MEFLQRFLQWSIYCTYCNQMISSTNQPKNVLLPFKSLFFPLLPHYPYFLFVSNKEREKLGTLMETQEREHKGM